MNAETTKQFIAKFPKLESTLSILDKNNIQWMIGGSGSLFLLGNKRVPDDVDIFIQDSDHDKVDMLFGIKSFQYTSATENVRNSNPDNDHSMQITSHLAITTNSKKYDLRITDDVVANRIQLPYQERTLWLLPPEDVLLIKALLQRGKDVGKNDIEDITNFMKDRVGDVFGIKI